MSESVPRAARGRRSLISTCLSAAAIAAGAAAVCATPAPAAVNEPPAGGISIFAFPVRDFVSSAGFQPTDRVTVNVIRGAATIGTATDVVPQDDPKTPGFDGLVDVNHPGGACWETNTPDIRAGDVIRTTITGGPRAASGIADQTTVQDVTAGPTIQTGPGSVIVHGTGRDLLTADGRFPAGQLSSRLIANKDLFDANGRRTLRAVLGAGGNDGTLDYDQAFNGNVNDPTNYTWTATYTGLDNADMNRALNTAESRGMWLGRVPAAAIENTVWENGQVGGPAAPCKAPLVTTGITGVSRHFINAADTAASPDVVVAGLSADGPTGVTGVAISSPGMPTHATPTFTPTTLSATAGARTWSMNIPASELIALPDGPITLTATYTPAAIPPDTITITKDTVAPGAPVITPGTGAFNATQSVAISADPGTLVRYTIDGGTPVTYTGAFDVTSTHTIRATATDAAGNVGPQTTAAITIDRIAPTSTITGATTSTSGGVVSLGSSTPSTNATFTFTANEPTQMVECQLDGGNWTPCSSPQSYTGLGAGSHRFLVRATDVAGNLEASPPSRNWSIDGPPQSQEPQQLITIIQVPAPAPGAVGVKGARESSPLRLAGVSAPRRVSLSQARRGVKVRMTLPDGTQSLDVALRRGGKDVMRRTVARTGGTYVLTVKVTRKGIYRLTLTPRRGEPGASRTVTFKVG